MKLSVLIPARNEATCIAETVACTIDTLRRESIPNEIVIVDDGSDDLTSAEAGRGANGTPIRILRNDKKNGFGMAVRMGLSEISGDAVAIMMADGSDSPQDLVRYYRKLQEGYECVFGSRFIRGGGVEGYPPHKLVINRLANWFIMLLFGIKYNDVTNAFKCYRREVIDGMQPLISVHFNLTVEMPLKAIVRGYSFAVIPITWRDRRTGVSKLRLQEMGSRYFFIVSYLWLERLLSRGDYRRPSGLANSQPGSDESALQKRASAGRKRE